MRKYYSILFIFLLLLFLITGQSTPKDLDERAEEALEYCKENGYSTDYCLLVDYGRHSGRVRFFIWDFNKGKPILKSLCAHGYGKGSTARKPVFSNEPGSFCSSLGHYRVGKEKTMSKPKGRKALVLYGKDKTNSNALQSEGCITIPFRKYSEVVETVKSSSKPLMLWVYE